MSEPHSKLKLSAETRWSLSLKVNASLARMLITVVVHTRVVGEFLVVGVILHA